MMIGNTNLIRISLENHRVKGDNTEVCKWYKRIIYGCIYRDLKAYNHDMTGSNGLSYTDFSL